MSTSICRFYLQGNCRFGSSCRFLHSNDRGHRSNNQYHDEYNPRNNRHENQSHYGNDFDRSNNNYESDGRKFNHHSKKDYNSRNNYEDNYNSRNNYSDDYGSVNKHKSKKDYNSKSYYKDYDYSENRNANSNYKYTNNSNYDDENNREKFTNNDYKDNYNSRSNYNDDYGSLNNHKSNKDYNSKNYYKNIDYSENRKVNSNNKYTNNSNYDDKNNRETFTTNNYNVQPNSNSFRFNHPGDHLNIKHNQANVVDREKRLKMYEKEIINYQTHAKQLFESNVWPLTCYHPIGNAFPIQPVGSLNLTEVSFEEIRCDYYITKSICATPELIHKQSVENLMSRAQKKKENILSLTDNVLDELLATFDKCERSRTDHTFVNCIQADNNSYWDMSIRELNKPKSTKSAIDSFSFVSNNGKNKNPMSEDTSLKIFMQNEVHGNMDCEAFEQEHFTDFIPIMPPPKKYCV